MNSTTINIDGNTEYGTEEIQVTVNIYYCREDDGSYEIDDIDVVSAEPELYSLAREFKLTESEERRAIKDAESYAAECAAEYRAERRYDYASAFAF